MLRKKHQAIRGQPHVSPGAAVRRIERRQPDRQPGKTQSEPESLAKTMEALFADLPVGVAVLDRRFTYQMANPAYLRAVGLAQGQVAGQNHFALFPDPSLRVIFQRVLESGEAYHAPAAPLPFLQQPGQPAVHWTWTLQPLSSAAGSKALAGGLLLTVSPALAREPEDAAVSLDRLTIDDARASVSEAQLRHTRIMYQHLFESTGDANIIVNEAGVIISANHQAGIFFGYAQNEMVGMLFELLVPEAKHHLEVARRASHLREPDSISVAADLDIRLELAGRRKDGSAFPTEITLNPVKVGSGLFVLCVVRDVTLRESHEQELRMQYGMVHLLQDIAVAANEATSLDSAFRYALSRMNRQLDWVLGHAYLVDEDGVISSTSIWTEATHPFDPSGGQALDPIFVVPQTGLGAPLQAPPSGSALVYPDPVEGRFEIFKAVSDALRFLNEASLPGITLNSGQPVWLNNLPENTSFSRRSEARYAGLRTGLAIPIMAGKNLVGVMEFFHVKDLPPDPNLMAVLPHVGVQIGRVVERYRSEQALRKAAAQLRMVMTNLPVILWVTDREGVLLMIEGREIADFQSRPEIVLGKNVFEQFDTHPDLIEQVRHALAGREIHTEIAGEGGAVFETYLMPYYDANWAVDGMIGLAFDISERKRMQVELDDMRRRLLQSIDTERARLATQLHDGPLQDLFGAYYQIQEIKSSLAEPYEEIANRALSTIQGVNATLRVICGELHPNTLVHLGLEKAIRSHASRLKEHLESTNLHLDLQSDDYNLPLAMRLGMYRAYQQLINNAVQHSAAADIWIRLRFEPINVILEVQDNGVGFEYPVNWVELVRRGSLGLASTLERVQGLNGRLTIDTRPGQGAFVRVSMPVTSPD